MILVAACKSPAAKTKKAQDELASWAATGASLAENWSRRSAQTAYVKSTIEVASRAVDNLRDALQGDRSVAEVAKLYEMLSSAVEHEDRASAARLAAPFAAISKRVKPPS